MNTIACPNCDGEYDFDYDICIDCGYREES